VWEIGMILIRIKKPKGFFFCFILCSLLRKKNGKAIKKLRFLLQKILAKRLKVAKKKPFLLLVRLKSDCGKMH
jgi:hypothetical protein